jgi:hypothetical protein
MAFLFIHHQSKNQICLKKSQNPHKITKNYSFSIRSRNHNYHYRPKTILCVFLHIKHWMSGLHASPFTSSDNVIAHDDHAQQPPNSFLIFFLCVYVCVCVMVNIWSVGVHTWLELIPVYGLGGREWNDLSEP